jgi:hypothetical protein
MYNQKENLNYMYYSAFAKFCNFIPLPKFWKIKPEETLGLFTGISKFTT